MLLLFIHPISITTVFTGLVSPSAAVYDFTLPYPISYLCSIILNMNTKPHAEIKKIAIVTIIFAMICTTIVLSIFTAKNHTIISNYSDLPRPELAEGIRGSQFSIDKNIDESTVDQYLGRPDSVYRDLRMLKDPGDYEAIGGDSYLSGFIRGFEIVPYPYIINVTDLPPEVGLSYVGDTLFTNDGAGNYRANYQESLQILEDLFPKDKNIFLMCGGGGYAGAMKQLLISLGWDADKIYNVGGYWYYEGENNVPVKNTKNTEPTYDFWKVPYHDIDFSTLHKVSRS